MTPQEKELYERNIEYHGIEQETTIAMEECSELIQAISKCKRYGCVDKYRDNLIEEIADVLFAIDELKLIYSISDDTISEIKQYKIDRQAYRIENNL